MKLWKRNAVIVAVIAFVGAAVYLNWTYGQEQQTWKEQREQETLSQTSQGEEKILGQPVLVGGTVGTETTEGEENNGANATEDGGDTVQTPESSTAEPSSTAGQTGNTAGDDYFASARLSRQQARDSAMSLLKEAPEESAETAKSIQTLANSMMAESRIENLVTAKGYADCVALISENSASIVVAAEKGVLEAEDVARIMDIVTGETAFSQNQIKIVPAALGEA